MPLLVNRNAFNQHYLNTKESKLGHMMTPVTRRRWKTARCKPRRAGRAHGAWLATRLLRPKDA